AFFVFGLVLGLLGVLLLRFRLQGGDVMAFFVAGLTMPGVGGGFSIDVYDRLIYHSVVIHGFCSGLVAGMMADGSALAGGKLSRVRVAVAMIAFVILKFFFLS
ncbi:MAG: hypothetical protein O0W93_06600, partial [Methanocorpusculum sp.]|nr:hypothetical protein [Methanocorpusculum sp.]